MRILEKFKVKFAGKQKILLIVCLGQSPKQTIKIDEKNPNFIKDIMKKCTHRQEKSNLSTKS